MKEKTLKSEFLTKCEAFNEEIASLINSDNKDRKAIIVIAVETDKNDDTNILTTLLGKKIGAYSRTTKIHL